MSSAPISKVGWLGRALKSHKLLSKEECHRGENGPDSSSLDFFPLSFRGEKDKIKAKKKTNRARCEIALPTRCKIPAASRISSSVSDGSLYFH